MFCKYHAKFSAYIYSFILGLLPPRRLWSWFTAVDTDRSGHITVHELREYITFLAREAAS